MNTNRRPTPAEPSLREALAAMGVEPSSVRSERLRRERYLRQVAESRKAAESAICIAMVTSSIPGIEVRHLD